MTDGAWERLGRWRAARSADGDAALDALADVGEVRRLLDQTELAAVRTARRQGRSWSEIATQLGIARQSAWEKWRDLDEAGPGAQQAIASAAADEVANERRRRGKVRVPDVVGESWEAAGALLRGVDLLPVNGDEDAAPPTGSAGWYVAFQAPESGARVSAGSSVRLWLRRRDGGAGVREPREPRPRSGSGRAMRPEPSERAG
jgi:transposase-like protein